MTFDAMLSADDDEGKLQKAHRRLSMLAANLTRIFHRLNVAGLFIGCGIGVLRA